MHLALSVVSLFLVALAGPQPPWVLRELPPTGSTPAHVAAIGAELDLTKAEGADPASLQLTVDGVDVTLRSTITMTRDWPPSFVSIVYTPTQLQPGAHRAEARLRTKDDRTLSYAWTFAISPP